MSFFRITRFDIALFLIFITRFIIRPLEKLGRASGFRIILSVDISFLSGAAVIIFYVFFLRYIRCD